MLPISQAADDLIVNEETGGRAYYEKTEIHPDWPGGASGVTIGIGYDCGYADAKTIRTDWAPYLASGVVDALAAVAGIHGSPASAHAAATRGQSARSAAAPATSATAAPTHGHGRAVSIGIQKSFMSAPASGCVERR